MKVERDGDIMTVYVKPQEILDRVTSGLLNVGEMEYLCRTLYLIGRARTRRQSIHTISSQGDYSLGLHRAIRVTGANMCLDIVENADISKKGLSRFRQDLRETGARIENDRVVCMDDGAAACLDTLSEFAATRGLYDRAIAASRSVVPNIDVDWDNECALRIGLLALCAQNNPDMVLCMEYDMSRNLY